MLPEARMLVVDLSNRSFRREILPEKVMRDYLGGRGLGAYLLYHSIPAGLDPFSPDNPLIFTVGFAQGVETPFSPKVVVSTKSPLTKGYLYSLSSGTFGHTIRRAGYMAILIQGKAEKPVYLRIMDDQVEFRDACPLWGMKTLETQRVMLEETGDPKGSTAAIGPAGEKLIKYAAIVNDMEKFRSFGRGGAGAVMGSKNLKGIVVSGRQAVRPADAEKFRELLQKVRQGLKENRSWAEIRRAFGTGEDMPVMNQMGMLPTRNWQTGVLEAEKLSGIAPTLNKDKWPRENTSCGPYCPNPCSHHIEIREGSYQGVSCDGPEYESMYAFGSNCGIGRFDLVVAAAAFCDEYGIDVISSGLTVSFLMECFTRGLITTTDTDGLELRFGDDAAIMACLRKIVDREGAGYLWGEGTRVLSGRIPGSSPFAMHCKGLEIGGYECRGFFGQALEFAVNPKGGDHHGMGLPARTEAADGTNREIKGKGARLKKEATERVIGDCLVICCFPRKIMVPLFETVVSALTGIPASRDYLDEVAWRIMTQERLFNTREGLRRTDDSLPDRLLNEPLPDGPYKGSTVPLEALKDEAYGALGWDLDTGIPREDVVRSLGIEP